MGKFFGTWIVMSILLQPSTALRVSLLLNKSVTKTYRTTMLIACTIHLLNMAPFAALLASLH